MRQFHKVVYGFPARRLGGSISQIQDAFILQV